MWLQICLLSSIYYICSAQQNNFRGRIFPNPFMVRVIRRDPQPPPPATLTRPRASSSPCPDGCDPGYVCYGGGCQKMGDSLCSPMCEENHTCHHGHCHYEPCRPSCGNGQRCINGRCEDIPCRPRCLAGFVCNRGSCDRDRGGQCTPACPPGYRCHDGHCDVLNSNPHHETCDRPCPPPSRCVEGHCTGEALTVGAVSPTDVRSVNNNNPTSHLPNQPNFQNLPNLPFLTRGQIPPFVPGSQPGQFSPLTPNEQTNSLPSNDPNSRWLVRDSSGTRFPPFMRPAPEIIRPGGATNIPNNPRVPGSSGQIDPNPFPNAADLFPPITENSNSLPPFSLPRGPSNIGGGSSPLSGVSNSGTGMSLPPLTALGGLNPRAMPPAQGPVQGRPGNGGELLIPDIAEICQGGNCNGAPLAPGSNVGLNNQRPTAPQTQTQMVGRGDNCGEMTCFENEFCFDPMTSTCIGVNTGDARAP